MSPYRLSDLLDVATLQRMADAHFRSAGMPIGIIDATDGSVIVGAGWQELCVRFHRANPISLQRCRESDAYIGARLVEGQACRQKCKNGLWDIGVPIVVAGHHLATMFLGQFFYTGERPDEQFFREQARNLGLNAEDYIGALRKVPILSEDRVDQIVEYDKALARFIADIAGHALAKKEAEEGLKRQADFLQLLIDAMPYAIFYKDRQGRYLGCNRSFERFYGTSRERIFGKTVYDIAPRELADTYTRADEELLARQGTQIYEAQVVTSDGSRREVIFHKATFNGPDGTLAGIVGAVVDVTAHNRAEQERRRLQEQLSLAQRMESVGRLAGGVAHDLNNMLSVILGYAELTLDRLPPGNPLRADMEEIRVAAERSRSVTRQLLAFARRQVIEPRVIDVNAGVENTLKMLRRLIGENIELTWRPGTDVWPVLMDPTQLDQVLANLCVNARDAIADVGHIEIETGTARFDEADSLGDTDLVPGDFVTLSVRDDGCGMSQETLDKVFEPFFTTKEVGRGTGLGLATVYGIVKQNGGSVTVASELGKGTTFTVHLPRHQAAGAESVPAATVEVPSGRGETVLLVEDEEAILRMTQRVLAAHNYQVIAAASPSQALDLVRSRPASPALLITDVVMPEMNGRQLAEALGVLCPGIKCLYMSGYTADVIAQKGVLDKGCRFIQKPFTPADLALAARAALDDAE